MLKELVLKDFKSFREETVRFSPSGLTVLVGPNGSGKSSVLEGVFFAASSRFQIGGAPPETPLAVRKGAPGFELQLTVGGQQTVVQQARFAQRLETTRWVERPEGRAYLWDDSTRFPVTEPDSPLSKLVPFPRFFEVNLKALRLPLRPGQPSVTFAEQQVVQVLFDLKMGADVDAFSRLIARLQRVVPAVRGFAIQREAAGETDRYRLSFSMTTGANIDASQVSEGTLLALAILTAAERNDRPTVLLIDDIDRALHPTAQRELIKLLRAIVKEGNLEIICTTHSPYILSEFQYDEVRVLKELDGESRCMSLSDGPEAERWMKELDAGEYWSFIEHKLFQKSA